VEGSQENSTDDPLAQMKTFLLGRKVCTAAWLEKAGERLHRHLSSSAQ
jgi:TPP-dependent pyruvate/acetoin dehydrogenase alpha subunit